MKKILTYIGILLVLFYCLLPFLWTVITALKPPDEVFSLPVKYFPSKLSLENFENVFYKRPFPVYVKNSLIVSVGGTFLTILLASVISFKLRYLPVKKALSIQKWLLIGAIIPPTILVIPIFLVIKEMNLINNYLGLIISYTFLNLPFGIWMLYATFMKIPKEIDEAALIDGFRKSGILFKIILPLSKPGLAVATILTFIFCWNEFLIALTLMPDETKYTVPVGISMLSGVSVYEIPWGEINAAVTITVLPIIIIIALFQKWIIEGLTSGGVKG